MNFFSLEELNDKLREILEQYNAKKLQGLEVMEDRYELRSTAIVGQLPVEKWHEIVGDSTVTDAILDRIVHNSHRVDLQEKESMRKQKTEEVTA